MLKTLSKIFSLENFKGYFLLLVFSFIISFIPYVREFTASFIDDFFIKTENVFFYLPKERTKDLVFVYIDGATIESWGAKLKPLLPRDRLAKLIEVIAEKEPKIIFVDVFFDFNGNEREDRLLKETLKKILKKKSITFIFPVSLETSDIKGLKPLAHYPYFYKDLEKYKDKILVSVPLFFSFKNERDGVIRYFGYEIKASRELENREEDITLYNSAVVIYQKYRKIEKLDDSIFNSDFPNNRIRYFLNMERKNFVSVSAKDILNQKRKIDFKDKIVIIGVNYPFKEPRYKTPIGDIAGIYIIGNTVLTLDNNIVKDSLLLSLILSISLLIFLSLRLFKEDSKQKKSIVFIIQVLILIMFYLFTFVVLFNRYNLLPINFIVFYILVVGEFLKGLSDSILSRLWNYLKNLFDNISAKL